MVTLREILRKLKDCQLPSITYVAPDYTVGRLIRELEEVLRELEGQNNP